MAVDIFLGGGGGRGKNWFQRSGAVALASQKHVTRTCSLEEILFYYY